MPNDQYALSVTGEEGGNITLTISGSASLDTISLMLPEIKTLLEEKHPWKC
jgi:hypothetical protein